MQEIEDSELVSRRTRELYQTKGHSDGWIEKRIRGIAVRAELTEEWKNCDADHKGGMIFGGARENEE